MTVFTEPVIIAAIGGLLAQCISLIELHKVPKTDRPDFTDFVYWIPYILGPIFGGVFGYIYFNSHPPDNSMLAMHIGVSAPLVLRSMASIIPRNAIP